MPNTHEVDIAPTAVDSAAKSSIYLDGSRPGPVLTMADPRSLVEFREGEEGILERLDLPEDMAQRLMTMGFLPGSRVRVTRRAPGGDPRVYRVDGSEIALRAETAAHLYLIPATPER